MAAMRRMFDYFWIDRPRVLYFVFCCAVVLFLAWKRRDLLSVQLRRYLVLPSLLLLGLLMNPVVARLLVTQYEETRSLRFFWLIPATLLMAAVSVLLVDLFRACGARVLAAVALPLVVLMTVNRFYALRHTWQNQITNWYKIPEVVMDLCDHIVQDGTGLKKKAVFPTPLNLWVRQYRAEIELPYAWNKVNTQSDAAEGIYEIQEDAEGTLQVEELARKAVDGGYNYIVLAAQEEYAGDITACGFEEVYRIDTDPEKDTNSYDREYVLYRVTEGAG